jgi:hypothetical protein
MNRDFTLQQNEQIHFKRQATLEQNGTMGNIYVTTLRFAWVPFDSTVSNFVMSWGALESDKYKTGKNGLCAIRIKSVTGEAKEFYLGEANKTNVIEIENLRNAVKRVITGISAGSITQPQLVAANSRASRSSKTINLANAVTETRKRELLLEADGELRSQYNDMVRGGIVDEDDFWTNHAYLLNGDISGGKKGIVSSLLADKAGKRSLNPEIINEIFATKPIVKKVYDEKVPHDMTEDEFWQKYFLSEMFTRNDGSAGASASQTFSLNPRRELRTDDMFSRALAEERAKNRLAATSGSGSNSVGKKRPRMALDVDLTATYNDYHESEPLDPEDFKLHREMSAVLEKYARKSGTVMQQLGEDSREWGGGRERPFSEWGKDRLMELEEYAGPDVVPLHLSSSFKGPGASIVPQQTHKPVRTQSLSSSEVLSSLHSLFPDTHTAKRVLLRDIADLSAVTDRARKDAMHSGSGVSGGALAAAAQAVAERMEVPVGFEEVSLHYCSFPDVIYPNCDHRKCLFVSSCGINL